MLIYIIKAIRNDKDNISARRESRGCGFGKRSYEEWRCIFIEKKERNFVFKWDWLFQNGKKGKHRTKSRKVCGEKNLGNWILCPGKLAKIGMNLSEKKILLKIRIGFLYVKSFFFFDFWSTSDKRLWKVFPK